ncbi:hypothetical protein G7Y89_g12578 [Cudoniella acicularis]|uniref:ATP-grasp domain-containing protein n=1 Tax=Cudoniella acicularis TaxID=354080 RepID=A0A8H4VWV8_9HELO|nr:hypothetical protein G7Y89_g12578 [Cudoniella acicularis]
MKVLLTDGSGLTSRQIATILSRKHHEVHVLCPPGLTLTKLTHYVTKIHSVPPFGEDPYAWLNAALTVLRDEKLDVLLCTQEQVAIISAQKSQIENLGVRIAVPSFESLEMVMDKIAAYGTLSVAGLPQPERIVFSIPSDPAEFQLLPQDKLTFPAFLKTPIGTAGTGVRRIHSVEEVQAMLASPPFCTMIKERQLESSAAKFVLQQEIPGSLIMISGVFSHGTLLAWHACVRVYEGMNGGASKKVSPPLPIIGTHLTQLGKELNWHGALSLDAILEGDGNPFYIDINPRIVEPMNALLSGVDLVQALLNISLHPAPFPPSETPLLPKHGIEGVETHQALLAFLKASQRGRFWLCVEVFKVLMRFDMYAGSTEELTPVTWGDPFNVVVMVGLMVLLFVGGSWMGSKLAGGAVKGYALSEEGWRMILDRWEEGRGEIEKGEKAERSKGN